MTIEQLVKTGAIPENHWLTKVTVSDESVEILNGVVTWKCGTWEYGTWEEGIWKDGIWKGGVWRRGIWKAGTWEGGVWEGGIWVKGIWKDGIWVKGIWKDGIWKTGWESYGRCKWSCLTNLEENLISIGCITKSPEDWKKWLDSDETYTTKRDDPEFMRIKSVILQGIAILEVGKSLKG